MKLGESRRVWRGPEASAQKAISTVHLNAGSRTNFDGPRHRRLDVIVIGASSAGVEALGQSSSCSTSIPARRVMIPAILNRSGIFRVAHAVDGEPIRRGRID